jgi:transcriptional antiterminator RfaH
VESLQMRSDAEGIVGPEISLLAIGSKVRVIAGPFADYVGTLIGLDGRQRVTLLLSLLSGAVTASVPSESIASLSA